MATPEDIRRARDSLKENQTEFGRRFGVDQSTIHRWETDGPPERGPAKVAIEHVLSTLADVSRETPAENAA